MPFEYEKPAQVDGEWVNMRDLAKLDEAIEVRAGFLIDDPTNMYQGKESPRYIVKSKVVSSGDEIKTSCPKGYGRDDLFLKLVEYFEANPEATVELKFEYVKGSQYIDAVVHRG